MCARYSGTRRDLYALGVCVSLAHGKQFREEIKMRFSKISWKNEDGSFEKSELILLGANKKFYYQPQPEKFEELKAVYEDRDGEMVEMDAEAMFESVRSNDDEFLSLEKGDYEDETAPGGKRAYQIKTDGEKVYVLVETNDGEWTEPICREGSPEEIFVGCKDLEWYFTHPCEAWVETEGSVEKAIHAGDADKLVESADESDREKDLAREEEDLENDIDGETPLDASTRIRKLIENMANAHDVNLNPQMIEKDAPISESLKVGQRIAFTLMGNENAITGHVIEVNKDSFTLESGGVKLGLSQSQGEIKILPQETEQEKNPTSPPNQKREPGLER
jgi:hypothetical protein